MSDWRPSTKSSRQAASSSPRRTQKESTTKNSARGARGTSGSERPSPRQSPRSRNKRNRQRKPEPVTPTKQDQDSLMNIVRLKQDGRKTPEEYKLAMVRLSSPSQLSTKSLTEYYKVPDVRFANMDDVYLYRGYRKYAKIDEGAFGIVYKAIRINDNLLVAVKEIDLRKKKAKRLQEMRRELFVLQKVDNELIVKLIEHLVVRETLVIIMEYCAGGNLTTYLKEKMLAETEAIHLFKQMALAIKVLHRAGVAHRDVKLNNFLLDATRTRVKISDFGLSVVSYRKTRGILMAKTYCGTEPYMAPEILRRDSFGLRCYNPFYTDVWALGVCLYAMMTRAFPFKVHVSQENVYKSQMERRWKFPKEQKDTLSEEIKDITWHMLDPDPSRRITINGVVSHVWLNQSQPVTLSYDSTS